MLQAQVKTTQIKSAPELLTPVPTAEMSKQQQSVDSQLGGLYVTKMQVQKWW